MNSSIKRCIAPVVMVFAVMGNAAQAQAPACDEDCLVDLTRDFLNALVDKNYMDLPWADQVGFTDNDVGLQMGEGLWGTVTAVGSGFTVADAETGNVVWLGIAEEHGQAGYLALRLAVDDGRIAEVETDMGRDGPPAPFAPTDGYRVDRSFTETLPPDERTPRARMIALVEGYYNTIQLNDGKVFTEIADDCSRVTNGESTTHGGDIDVEGCLQQLEVGWYKPVDRVRSRRFPVVDEERGIVVAIAFLDHAARYIDYETLDGKARKIPIEYPYTHGVFELFKIEDGEITRVEGVTTFQPYLMPTKWDAAR